MLDRRPQKSFLFLYTKTKNTNFYNNVPLKALRIKSLGINLTEGMADLYTEKNITNIKKPQIYVCIYAYTYIPIHAYTLHTHLHVHIHTYMYAYR